MPGATPRSCSDGLPLDERPEARLVALSLLVGVLSVIIILDYTGYPYPPVRY